VIIIFVKYPPKHLRIVHFFHAGTSSGRVCNGEKIPDFTHWAEVNSSPTLFDLLDKNGISWKIYFDKLSSISLTLLIHYSRLKNKPNNFAYMDEFYRDMKHGTLPQYSFIEPRFFHEPNDMHPLPFGFNPRKYSPVLGAEVLLNDIYTSLRKARSPTGSNYFNTLLMVTFDEHGGTYDHVPPPKCPNPYGTTAQPGEMGFCFDRLGLRVPCLFISPWIRPETVISDQLQHCSILRFICHTFGIEESLTDRDKYAPLIPDSIFDLKHPRDASEWPQPTPRPYFWREGYRPCLLVTGLQSDVFNLICHIGGSKKGVEALENVSDLHQVFSQLVGKLSLHQRQISNDLNYDEEDDEDEDFDEPGCCLIL